MVIRHGIVPFTCVECGKPFHELDGGRCYRCGHLCCRRHLTKVKEGALCRRCAEQTGSAGPQPLGGRPVRLSGKRDVG
jgi:hypothetical protein